MIALTSIERVKRTFERKPVDRLPVIVNPWSDTLVRWRREEHLGPDEDYIVHTDHSEPPEVHYETMKFFVESGRGMCA